MRDSSENVIFLWPVMELFHCILVVLRQLFFCLLHLRTEGAVRTLCSNKSAAYYYKVLFIFIVPFAVKYSMRCTLLRWQYLLSFWTLNVRASMLLGL